MTTAQKRRLAADKKADAKVAARMEKATQDAITKHGSLTAAVEAGAVSTAQVDQAFEKVSTRKRTQATCTAEDIVRERDEKGLSWKQVAINLDLGSPGAARTAYTRLTGKPHNESTADVKRAPRLPKSVVRGERRKTLHPHWSDESDQDEIIERVDGSVIVVNRNFRGIELPEERIAVARIDSFRYDGKKEDGPLCITVIDRETSAARTFRVADISEVL